MKFVFKIGSFDLKAQGNTITVNDTVIEVEMTGEEFIQNSKDGLSMVKEIMSVAAAEQVAAERRSKEREAERELSRIRNEE